MERFPRLPLLLMMSIVSPTTDKRKRSRPSHGSEICLHLLPIHAVGIVSEFHDLPDGLLILESVVEEVDERLRRMTASFAWWRPGLYIRTCASPILFRSGASPATMLTRPRSSCRRLSAMSCRWGVDPMLLWCHAKKGRVALADSQCTRFDVVCYPVGAVPVRISSSGPMPSATDAGGIDGRILWCYD